MKQLGWILIVGASVALDGCGMKGPLFLPDKNASVVTRPGTSGTTTPPAQTAPAPAPSDAAPSAPTTPSTPKQPQDKDKDDSQSTSSTPKS
jgi:predicted small lipoprotein YifL